MRRLLSATNCRGLGLEGVSTKVTATVTTKVPEKVTVRATVKPTKKPTTQVPQTSTPPKDCGPYAVWHPDKGACMIEEPPPGG